MSMLYKNFCFQAILYSDIITNVSNYLKRCYDTFEQRTICLLSFLPGVTFSLSITALVDFNFRSFAVDKVSITWELKSINSLSLHKRRVKTNNLLQSFVCGHDGILGLFERIDYLDFYFVSLIIIFSGFYAEPLDYEDVNRLASIMKWRWESENICTHIHTLYRRM